MVALQESQQQAQQQLESNEKKLNRLVAAQLCKTKMCAMFAKGTCRDSKCRFAHLASEKRPPVDLTKTAMCRKFAKGNCRNPDCKFAHGESDLRVTPSVYKTQLCNFHQRGHCKKGESCRHAHGEHELKPGLPLETEISAENSEGRSDVDQMFYQDVLEDVVEAVPSQVVSLEQIIGIAAQGRSQENTSTPPPLPANFSRNRTARTPEKVVPMFPGLQRKPPMSVDPVHYAPPPPYPQVAQNTLVAESLDLLQQNLRGDRMPTSAVLRQAADRIALAARNAQVAELQCEAAKMFSQAELEFKAKQLQVHRKMQIAADVAAGAFGAEYRSIGQFASEMTPEAEELRSILSGQASINASGNHYDAAIMQMLHQRPPLRDIAPMNAMNAINANMTTPVLPPGLACQAPPGLGETQARRLKEFQSWQPADISGQRNAAWVV